MTQENVLRCDLRNLGVPAAIETPQVADFSEEFTFTVGTLCMGDADNSGVVNFADVTSVLVNFGLPTPCLGLSDANRDGTVNFQDITDVLANFGATCDLCSGGGSMMAMSGGPIPSLPDALAMIGYASLEEFLAVLEVATDEKRASLLQQLGDALHQLESAEE